MRIKLLAISNLVAVGLLSGCQHFGEEFHESNITLHNARANSDARLQSMVDNASLNDMSIADIHFVPHTNVLNSLGEQRLQRYAEMLMFQGGTLRLQTRVTDEDFNLDRIESITNFLASAGIADGRIAAEPGLRGGRGIKAVEAILVKERAFAPEQQGLTDLGGGGGFGTGG